MALTAARTPPGVLELLPLEQIAFQDMLDTIRRSFERFGFLPVETPVMELSEILLTKEGGETERQVYFVQSTGNLEKAGTPELALRFDLTVPLARYVAEHEHKLNFPFRRYQMQRVYRGERQQRGRFREFYQCDIDVIGKDSLSIRFDAELPAVIYQVFRDLKIGPFAIQLNNRKLLRGFFENLGQGDAATQALILREIDKLDKVGAEKVAESLRSNDFGLDEAAIARILHFVQIRSSGHADAIAQLDALGQGSDAFNQGIDELRQVLELIRALGVPEQFYALNLSIARGLDYYTGTVYETHLLEHAHIGSICSGGRYENLAGHYTKSHLPGVGISIGATRLFWQLREAGLIGTGASTVQVLVTQMDEAELPRYLAIANELRQAGINSEVVLEPGKLAKQMKYAEKAGIAFAVIAGGDEFAKDTVLIKDLHKREQFEVARSELVKQLRVELEQAQAMSHGTGKK